MASCDKNVVEWISKMEMKRINIELKIPGAYKNHQFLMDVCTGALLEKCKTFTNEIQSQKQKWLLGKSPNSGHIDTTNLMIQLYSYLIEYGTWNKYLSETDKIVALTTLLHEMKGTTKSNTIAFAANAEKQDTSHPTKNNCCPQKGSYTVDVWRLVKKEETETVDEKTWYWCTKDHYSKGIVHNGK